MSHRESNSVSTTDRRRSTKSIGSYILGETIGEGTFGKVKLAKHLQTGEKVAVKILDKAKMIDNNDMKRVEKELSILQQLKHINIIQLYEIIHTNSNIYLIMEYADGGELFDYISNKKKLSELEACKFFQQIINSLDYLHKNKIVHRDLKPENLLLDGKKMIKVSDFGLSTKYSKKKKLRTACGTPSYAPPEMINGEDYCGLKSDVWSCGVILYAMLVGYLPFYESNEDIVCQKILQAQFDFPTHLSETAKDLIKKILIVDPEERYDLEQIRKHQYFNLISPVVRPGIIPGINKIPIDENILNKMKEYNLNPDKVRRCLEENELNQSTATYYLVLKKIVKAGGTSISDLYSDAFLQFVGDKNNLLSDKQEVDSDVSEESQEIEEDEDGEMEGNIEELESVEKLESEEKLEIDKKESDEKCDFLSLVKNKFEEKIRNGEKDSKNANEENSNKKKKNVKVLKIFNEKYKKKNHEKEKEKEKANKSDQNKTTSFKKQPVGKIFNLKTISKKENNKTVKVKEKEPRSRNMNTDLTTFKKINKKEIEKLKNFSVSPEKIYRALKNREKENLASPFKTKVLDEISKGIILTKVNDTPPKEQYKTLENSLNKNYKELKISVISEADEIHEEKAENEKIKKNEEIKENVHHIHKRNEAISDIKSIEPVRKETLPPKAIKQNNNISKKETQQINSKPIAKIAKPNVQIQIKTLKPQNEQNNNTNTNLNLPNLKAVVNYSSNKDTKISNLFPNKDIKQDIVDLYQSTKITRNLIPSSSNTCLLTNDITVNLMNYYSSSSKTNEHSFNKDESEKKVFSARHATDKRFIFNDDEIKYYYGIVDINLCFEVQEDTLLEKISNSLNKAKISFIQTKKYKLKCSKTGLSFDIEICLLVDFKAKYVKIKKNKGDNASYTQLLGIIISDLIFANK